MNTEKIFWLMTVAVIAGFFVFLAFGIAVKPVSAVQQADAGQQNSFPAPYPSGLQPSAGSGAQIAAPAAQGGTLAAVNNGVQEVTLGVQGGSYMPNPIRVKKGVPVKLVADLSSVRGCASSIVIPEFGIRKTVRQGDNTIEFTPDKSGTFSFSCSMGMYQGTIVVEEADGTVAAFAGNAPKIAAGSCGGPGGSGGCGCGG